MAAGCAHRGALDRPARPLEDPAELLKLTDEVEGKVERLSSPARLAVDSAQLNASMPLFAAVAPPDRLYLEVHDFFGKPQAVLTTDGQWLGLYRADENRFYNGPASSKNVSRMMPLELKPEEWVGLFMAKPPRLTKTTGFGWDPKAKAYRLELAGEGEARQTLWIDSETHRVIRSEVRGPVSYDASYADFDRSPAHLPRELHLVSHTPPGKLDLAYKDPQLNPSQDPQTFTPKPPAGAMSLPLPEGGF